jgi:predicted MPP superfamily phosphohydrolase
MERWSSRLGGGVEEYSFGGFAGGPVSSRAHGLRSFEEAIEVTEHRIILWGLPEAFRGFRIVQLSDIHHGLYLPLQALIDAVEMTNRLRPDLVALTGDFVTYSRAYIEPAAAILGLLQARFGIFAVLGNHDFRVGAEAIARALRRERIHVLRNRQATLHLNGDVLHIAGVDDLGYGADLHRAVHRIPREASTILLAHNPAIIPHAARHGIGLVLSGHTHGGQLNFPLVGSIFGRSPGAMRFKSGWDRLGRTQIYVSRGIGTVVLPLRVRCPAEIPHFELQPLAWAPQTGHAD